jgi:hypothetical protein
LIERAIKYFFGGNAIVAVVVPPYHNFPVPRASGFSGKTCATSGSIAPPASNIDIIRAQAEHPHSAVAQPDPAARIQKPDATRPEQRAAQAALAPLINLRPPSVMRATR